MARAPPPVGFGMTEQVVVLQGWPLWCQVELMVVFCIGPTVTWVVGQTGHLVLPHPAERGVLPLHLQQVAAPRLSCRGGGGSQLKLLWLKGLNKYQVLTTYSCPWFCKCNVDGHILWQEGHIWCQVGKLVSAALSRSWVRPVLPA